MKTIKDHIKNNSYSCIYLLYGSQSYLKRLYRDKLVKGMLGEESDDMNLSFFEGADTTAAEVMDAAETLPFFAEKRVVVVENSKFFHSQSPMADYIKKLPETTHLLFVESEVDKRSRLYKAVSKMGTVTQLETLDEKNLMLWVASTLEQGGKKATANTIRHLLERSGTDMDQLSQEIEKLLCYAMDRTVVESSDVDAVCTVHISNEIFRMVDAVADGKGDVALALYQDLMALREKPIGVLYLLTRHFNILLQAKDMDGQSNLEAASHLGVPPFAMNKYRTQTRRFSNEELRQVLTECADAEERFKTGKIGESLTVELLIAHCGKMHKNL